MGCCLTTPTATATAAAGDDHHHQHEHVDNSKPISKLHGGPRPPEEETVKEVLSETPIISKPPPPSNSTPTKITGDNHQILHPVEELKSVNDAVRFTKNPIEDEVSSEMYTYSESFSAATTTTTSFATDLKRSEIGIDEDGEVTQKVKKRRPANTPPRKQPMTSYSGERARRKERGIRPPPPARRSTIPSTDKKIQLPTRNITTTQRHRNVVQSNAVRREPPARRSRSPAMRREEVQLRKVKERSPVPKSGNRIPVKLNENKGSFKLQKNTNAGLVPEPEPEPEPETETCESLENPLVSLECFIFL